MMARAGMAGAVSGIDWQSALALAARALESGDFDGDMLDACLTAVDQGLAAGARKRESD